MKPLTNKDMQPMEGEQEDIYNKDGYYKEDVLSALELFEKKFEEVRLKVSAKFTPFKYGEQAKDFLNLYIELLKLEFNNCFQIQENKEKEK